jgi:hypothetical protein
MSRCYDRRSLRNDRDCEIGKKMMIEPRLKAKPPPHAVAKAGPIDQHAAAASRGKMLGQGAHFFAARNGAEGRKEQRGPAGP